MSNRLDPDQAGCFVRPDLGQHCLQKFRQMTLGDKELSGNMVVHRFRPISSRALTPLFGNGAGAHGIGKISGVLTKIGKFDIVLMYDVSIARFSPIIKLTFFFIYNVIVSN